MVVDLPIEDAEYPMDPFETSIASFTREGATISDLQKRYGDRGNRAIAELKRLGILIQREGILKTNPNARLQNDNRQVIIVPSGHNEPHQNLDMEILETELTDNEIALLTFLKKGPMSIAAIGIFCRENLKVKNVTDLFSKLRLEGLIIGNGDSAGNQKTNPDWEIDPINKKATHKNFQTFMENTR